MKKLKLILFLFTVIFLLQSCNNDDDNSNAENPISGTWEITEINFNSQEDGVVVTDETFSTDVCNAPFIFAFGPDGDFSIPDAELEFDVDFNDNAILLCSVSDGTLPGSWEQTSGNNYILTIENEPSEAEIRLSDNDNSIEIILVNEDYDEIDDITYTDTITFIGVRN
jgi:hypothetical protein